MTAVRAMKCKLLNHMIISWCHTSLAGSPVFTEDSSFAIGFCCLNFFCAIITSLSQCSKTSEVHLHAWEGGIVFSLNGESVGMNLFLVMGRTIFLPWGTIFEHLRHFGKSWQRLPRNATPALLILALSIAGETALNPRPGDSVKQLSPQHQHHCRNCGEIFCDKCSQGRIALTAEDNAPLVRVCDRCMAEVTQRLSIAKDVANRSATVQSHEDLARKLKHALYFKNVRCIEIKKNKHISGRGPPPRRCLVVAACHPRSGSMTCPSQRGPAS
ncbi:hypothetical protein ACJX0J_010787, partial [Zea mays]